MIVKTNYSNILTIDIDYLEICKHVLRVVKRDSQGLISYDSLINAFIHLKRESEYEDN